MQLPRLEMTSQRGMIAIEQTSGQQTIRQEPAHMSIEQPHASLNISSKRPRLTIDQTKAWDEMNLMSTEKFVRVHANEGLSAVTEGMNRRTEQGIELMRIEHQGNPLARQAELNGFKQQQAIGLTYIPSPLSVKIDVEPGELHIEAVSNPPVIRTSPNRPHIHFERGNVNVEMKQYADIHIEVVDPKRSIQI